MHSAEERIHTLGLKIPAKKEKNPESAIESAKKLCEFIYVSGHGPITLEGKMVSIGKVGEDITPEEGYEAARLCALNCLASVRGIIGSLDRVSKIIQVRGFVNSAPDFFDQPKVVNGASELLVEVFGERGRHTRTAIGTASLPGNISVEVDMLLKLKRG